EEWGGALTHPGESGFRPPFPVCVHHKEAVDFLHSERDRQAMACRSWSRMGGKEATYERMSGCKMREVGEDIVNEVRDSGLRGECGDWYSGDDVRPAVLRCCPGSITHQHTGCGVLWITLK